jgi:cyclopropane-fatty-acyl-phospholipid synthase
VLASPPGASTDSPPTTLRPCPTAADYAETLTHWLARLEDRPEDAVRLAGEQHVRVRRIYLRAARDGFRRGFTSVYQVRAHLA